MTVSGHERAVVNSIIMAIMCDKRDCLDHPVGTAHGQSAPVGAGEHGVQHRGWDVRRVIVAQDRVTGQGGVLTEVTTWGKIKQG